MGWGWGGSGSERDGGGDGGDGKLGGFPHINGRSNGNGNGHVVEMESLSSFLLSLRN